VAEFMQESIVF